MTDSMQTLTLVPENNSFQGTKAVIISQPFILGRMLDNQPAEGDGFLRFNSKVVSRQHCRITYTDGKFYVQDTKSSSGTFVNGERLSPQGQESKLVEVTDRDILKMGEDYNQGGSVHQAIVMKVRLPGYDPEEDDSFDAPIPLQEEEQQYVDVTVDDDVRAIVDDEFNTIWNSLVADINSPLKKLRSGGLASPSTLVNDQVSPQATPELQSRPISLLSQTQSSIGAFRGDNSITLIKTNNFGLSRNDTITERAGEEDGSKTPGSLPDSTATVEECIAMIQSLTWESGHLKDTLLDLARKHDSQLLAFYRSLKGFPSSFVNVASKYAKFSKKK